MKIGQLDFEIQKEFEILVKNKDNQSKLLKFGVVNFVASMILTVILILSIFGALIPILGFFCCCLSLFLFPLLLAWFAHYHGYLVAYLRGLEKSSKSLPDPFNMKDLLKLGLVPTIFTTTLSMLAIIIVLVFPTLFFALFSQTLNNNNDNDLVGLVGSLGIFILVLIVVFINLLFSTYFFPTFLIVYARTLSATKSLSFDIHLKSIRNYWKELTTIGSLGYLTLFVVQTILMSIPVIGIFLGTLGGTVVYLLMLKAYFKLYKGTK